MTFHLNCDCTYVAKARLFLFMSIREKGAYWVEDGRISLTRASGEVTSWPFRLDAGQLLLEEHHDEVHTYTRRSARICGG
jgi:hypothetical protein